MPLVPSLVKPLNYKDHSASEVPKTYFSILGCQNSYKHGRTKGGLMGSLHKFSEFAFDKICANLDQKSIFDMNNHKFDSFSSSNSYFPRQKIQLYQHKHHPLFTNSLKKYF